METLYRKLPNGRYVENSVGFNHELADGIWVVRTGSNSKSYTSAVYLVGKTVEPTNFITHASINTMSDMLTKYLMNLKDVNSEDYQEAEDILGGFLRGPVEFYNISAHDIIHLILRKVAMHCDIETNTRTRMIW